MSDDDSNDVVVVNTEETGSNPGEGTSADPETRPIMQLFQRLISNDNKQNTVLTNAQIISILLKEFDIDVTTLHELEVDIYLNIVKRFLKDWPKWDEFDQDINLLRKKNAYKSIKKTLESKYVELKKYLKVQLDATKPLAEKAVKDMIKENAKRMENVDTSDITLEVYCTRKQLNELVLSQPTTSGEGESNIFNLTEFNPNKITVNKLPIESILNLWGIQVSVEAKCLSLTRLTKHRFKHTIVNAKNGPRNLKRTLDTRLQTKDLKRQSEDLDKQKLISLFIDILQSPGIDPQVLMFLQCFFNMVISDLPATPGELKVPATYRQHSNMYPYYRKLRKQVDNAPPSQTYDLYLEEILSPLHLIHIGKVGTWGLLGSENLCITLECLECKFKFTGSDVANLRQHFDTYHSNEPDWICTNCEKGFPTTELTQNKWFHSC